MWSPLSAAGSTARWACSPAASRGRRYPQTEDPQRNVFQRDRDRVLHCSAFRRGVYKTQVFASHQGDLFRSRLTHSLEVAQIGRSLAPRLGLDSDLTETIALAHDLGHTPFGHAGQDALHRALKAHAPEGPGFEHNVQSLRVVDVLEDRYPTHPGLNLSWEARSGILKHCSALAATRMLEQDPQSPALRLRKKESPSLEAQLCDWADAIAYVGHDIDDGVRSGLLSLDQLREIPWVNGLYMDSERSHPSLSDRHRRYDLVRRITAAQIHDIEKSSLDRLASAAPESPVEVALLPPLIGFSEAMERDHRLLKSWLHRQLYRHPEVTAVTDLAQMAVETLFKLLVDVPGALPHPWSDQEDRVLAATDYLAGMTDRMATRCFEQWTGRVLFPAD